MADHAPLELIERAQLLMADGREREAETVLRLSLTENEGDPVALAFLALSLKAQHRFGEAEAAADAAIASAPQFAFAHYVRGSIALQQDQDEAAEQHGETAVLLDPSEAQGHALVAAARMGQRHWAQALEAADEALRLEPTHVWAGNMRAQLLVRLGRDEEARRAMDANLSEHPGEAYTQANQGWVLLHTGDAAGALAHFEEALRLEPTMAWAKEGVLTALKARWGLYRLALGFSLQLGRLRAGQQWAVLLVGFIGMRLLRGIAKDNPALAPFIWPVVYLYAAFVVLTWVADPLFNLLLRFDRYGRLLLSEQQLRDTTLFGGLLGGAIASAVAYGVFEALHWRQAAMVAGAIALMGALMILPVAAMVNTDHPQARRRMQRAVGVLAACGLLFLAAMATHQTALALLVGAAGSIGYMAFQLYANRVAISGKA
jgi:tetratricopeptide (TPR) repeat protein